MEPVDCTMPRPPLLATLGLSVLLHGAALFWLVPQAGGAVDADAPAGLLRVLIVSSFSAQAQSGADSTGTPQETVVIPASAPAPATKAPDAERLIPAKGAELASRTPPSAGNTPAANRAPPPVKRTPAATHVPPPEQSRLQPSPAPPNRSAEPVLSPAAAANAAQPAVSGVAVQRTMPYSLPVYDADYLDNPPPAYPPLARRMQLEGRVVLRVRVGMDGDAQEVLLDTGSGHAILDRAALAAVRRWRFVPARRGSEPVEAWVRVPLVFRLAGR